MPKDPATENMESIMQKPLKAFPLKIMMHISQLM
jgi:hypothetical protein